MIEYIQSLLTSGGTYNGNKRISGTKPAFSGNAGTHERIS